MHSWGCVAKTAKQEDAELISSHGYAKIKITYKATIYENDF